jgi:hypothetical protein
MIRFFVMNEVGMVEVSDREMRVGGESVGYSGLCIQSNISNSLGVIEEWNRSLVDAYLVWIKPLFYLVWLQLHPSDSHPSDGNKWQLLFHPRLSRYRSSLLHRL